MVQTLLVSGGNDGTLSLWSVDGAQASREALPKLSVKVVVSYSVPASPTSSPIAFAFHEWT